MIPQESATHAGAQITLQVVTLTAPRSLDVERLEPTLVVPVESAIIRAHADDFDDTIDRSAFVMIAAGQSCRVEPTASVARVVLLELHDTLIKRTVRTYRPLGMDRSLLATWLLTSTVLPRTVWVHEIVHRYMFERHALGEHKNDATKFLEVEILKELYFLFRDRDEGADRSSIQRKHGAPVARALAHLEEHLFASDLVMSRLARHAGVSESTLLRAFRRELGCTPAAYWRRRRLESALDLLRSGQHSVAEIAETVGYENATAFGYAFRLQFGHPPSYFLPRGRQRPAP